jgi:hypothetical protein
MRRLLWFAAAVFLAACSQSEPEAPAAPAEQPPGPASVVQVADPKAAVQLLEGWHAVEQNAWRWTQKRFAVSLRPPAPGKAATLQLKFSLPEALLKRLQSVTLSAAVNGVALPGETYTAPGAHVYARSVPANALAADVARVDFSLDKALPPGEVDSRELGIVVSSVGLE